MRHAKREIESAAVLNSALDSGNAGFQPRRGLNTIQAAQSNPVIRQRGRR